MKILYNPILKERSRILRRNSTLAEVLLWNQLKARRFRGFQFMRQKPIGDFIVDFYCARLRLVIEIDGSSHLGKDREDRLRDDYLRSIGLDVIRIADVDVKNNMSGVFSLLQEYVDRRPEKPNPDLSFNPCSHL